MSFRSIFLQLKFEVHWAYIKYALEVYYLIRLIVYIILCIQAHIAMNELSVFIAAPNLRHMENIGPKSLQYIANTSSVLGMHVSNPAGM